MTEQTSAAGEPVERVLKQLNEWRHLPAYALERRVDVFIGMFLSEILKSKKGLIPDGSELEVIPEFPLHKKECEILDPKGKPSKGNHSVKVDFAVFCKEENKLILVELKTDAKSTSNSKNQLSNMHAAKTKTKTKEFPTRAIIQGVIEAAKNSPEKRKYAHLICKLHQIGCIEFGESQQTNLRTWQDMCLKANGTQLTHHFKSLGVSKEWSDACIKLVLIHPKPRENPPEHFLCPPKFECITLAEAACAIQGSQDSLGATLAPYLCGWSSTTSRQGRPREHPDKPHTTPHPPQAGLK